MPSRPSLTLARAAAPALLALALATTAATAPARADEPVRYELDGSTLKLPGPILFETGREVIRAESEDALRYVQGYLAAKDAITTLRIEGHSDATGAESMNQELTERRALAVARWLAAHGVDCRRLLPVGFGSQKPIADNQTPEGRAANRRMAFVNAALRGRAIGGMPADGGGRVAGDPCTTP